MWNACNLTICSSLLIVSRSTSTALYCINVLNYLIIYEYADSLIVILHSDIMILYYIYYILVILHSKHIMLDIAYGLWHSIWHMSNITLGVKGLRGWASRPPLIPALFHYLFLLRAIRQWIALIRLNSITSFTVTFVFPHNLVLANGVSWCVTYEYEQHFRHTGQENWGNCDIR